MNDRKKIFELFEQQKEYTEKRISDGIEKHRKGNAELLITDREGNPISNAAIKVNQKTHEFRFGANLFMLEEFESQEKNEKYKKCFSDTFNMATLPFYWNTLEPERNKTRYDKNSPKIYRRPATDLCIEFCQEHGIEPREHALAYDRFFPKWLYDSSAEEVKTELERRFKEISERYADKIPTIEVTNEMSWGSGRTAFYEDPDYILWCFNLAEKYFPKNQLGINEFTSLSWDDNCRTTDKYYSYIQANMLRGAKIDAVGMQYHLFNTREDEYENTRKTLNPQRLYMTMDLYSTLGKPLQITEISIPAYSWEEYDEEIQAEMLEKLYSIWFSHPNVEQIVYWNLVDGYAHLDDPDPEKIKASQGNMSTGENYFHAGLLRFDMTPKPAYYTLNNLIKNVWHTNEKIKTDTDGKCSFRGFYGEYEIEIDYNNTVIKKCVTLSSKNNNEIKVEI